MLMNYSFTVVDRFLNYVKIDTQSDPHSASTPSTEKQKDLSRLLVKELQAMGVEDAEMDEHGYVYATVKSNTTPGQGQDVYVPSQWFEERSKTCDGVYWGKRPKSLENSRSTQPETATCHVCKRDTARVVLLWL